MALQERVYRVLIVSASEKFNTSLREILPESVYAPVQIVSSVAQAQRTVAEAHFDLILINTPLPDDFGAGFAIDACNTNGAVVMLMIKSELYDEVFSKVTQSGVMTLKKPTTIPAMVQAFDWMRSMRERLRGFEKKTVSLEDKMAEIRIVNRAKWALIESCKMTEADAHRYIEKQAMDRCVTRREIAEGILLTYQTV